MATRISLLNDDDAVWNDRDFTTDWKDFIGSVGAGFLNVHRPISHLQNAGFEEGSGSITADDWIGEDAFNAWYGFIEGTCSISFDTGIFDEGAQSLKIDQTVNSGAQSSGVRLTENASPSTTADERHLIPVKGGKTIKLEWALRTASISSGASGGAQVAIRQYDEDLAQTGTEDTSTYVTGTQAFTDDELEVTLEDDAKYIQIELRIDNETGTAYFDDLVLTELGTDIEITAQNPAAAELDVATGVCFFEIEDASANVFMVRFEVEVAETVSITNNSSGNDRIDVIYAFYDNSVDLDSDASNVGSIEVVEGTPAGSPTAPSVPANGFKIAEVYVANGASTFDSSTLTDYRVPVRQRNYHVSPATGEDQAISYEQAKAPATEIQVGGVVLNETPSDPSRPRVITNQYGGLLTESQKNDLVNSLIGSSFESGEALTGATSPVPVYQDQSDNRLYKADANDTSKVRFIGFVTSDASGAGEAVDFRGVGVVGGFTGLTEGVMYYVQDTAGTIDVTPATTLIQVGRAISATEILIEKGQFQATVADTLSSGTVAQSTVADLATITVGFRPRRIVGRLYAEYSGGGDEGEAWIDVTEQKAMGHHLINTGTSGVQFGDYFSADIGSSQTFMEFSRFNGGRFINIKEITDTGFVLEVDNDGNVDVAVNGASAYEFVVYGD